MTRFSSLKQGHNSPEVVNGSVMVPVTKRHRKWGLLLMQLLVVYLILVPFISLTKPPAAAAGDDKAPVSGSGMNHVSYGAHIFYPLGSFPAFYYLNFPIDGRDEISTGFSSQLESVGKDLGEKPSDITSDPGSDLDVKPRDIWHEISDYLPWCLMWFLAGYGPPDIFYGRTRRKAAVSKRPPSCHC